MSKEYKGNLVDRFFDWGDTHPHKATLLAMLGIGLFIFLGIITHGIFWIVAVTILITVVIYCVIYSAFTGQW